MGHGKATVGGIASACVAALLLACCSGCGMRTKPRNMPATPPEVAAARGELDAAFAAARDDPGAFPRLVGKAMTAYREELQKWAVVAGSDSARSAIRGWAYKVGAIETSILQLPKHPQEDQLRPIRDSWSRLRPDLP